MQDIWYVLLSDPVSLKNPSQVVYNTNQDEEEKIYADLIDKLMKHPHGESWCFFFHTDGEIS